MPEKHSCAKEGRQEGKLRHLGRAGALATKADWQALQVLKMTGFSRERERPFCFYCLVLPHSMSAVLLN